MGRKHEAPAGDAAADQPGGIGLAHGQGRGEAAKQQAPQRQRQPGAPAGSVYEIVGVAPEQDRQPPDAWIQQQAEMGEVGVAEQQQGIRLPSQELGHHGGVVEAPGAMGAGISGAVGHEAMGIALQQGQIPGNGLAEAAVVASLHAEIPEVVHHELQRGVAGQDAKPGGVILDGMAHDHRQPEGWGIHVNRRALLVGRRPNHQPTNSTTTTIWKAAAAKVEAAIS